jgi:hypothetical protein
MEHFRALPEWLQFLPYRNNNRHRIQYCLGGGLCVLIEPQLLVFPCVQ